MNRKIARTNDVGNWDALIACAQQRLRQESENVAKLRALLILLEAKKANIVGSPAETGRRKLSQ